jgi:hypothetical protein
MIKTLIDKNVESNKLLPGTSLVRRLDGDFEENRKGVADCHRLPLELIVK